MSMEHDNILEAQANFTINILNQIFTSSDGVAFSPYSLTLALAMCYIGTCGNTEIEFKNLLSPFIEKVEYCKMLKNSIGNVYNDSDGVSNIYIANRLFIQNDYVVKEKFKNDIENYLSATFENVNFSDPVVSAETINNFISNATHQKIKDLIKSNSISMDTKAIITNALYFKSQWKKKFNEFLTIDDEFYITNNEKKIVKMMSKATSLLYGGNKNFHIVKIPYTHSGSEFILILPKERNKLHSLLKKMDGKSLLKLIESTYYYKDVILTMPKFKVESSYSMKKVLTKMGLVTPFNENANFTGMTSTDKIKIDDVIHKVFVDVNEEGTEAAAATAIFMVGYSAPVSKNDEIIVKADHPFLYIILDNEKILFSGVYQ
uniref:SERPIN domain-containing protein n=1 Tax=Strongyloides papillosus TaxID=174720 RepID=A0A0N5CH49_STREA